MRRPVEMICSVVPKDRGRIVLRSGSDEEIEIPPACCRLGRNRAGIPFTNDERYIGKVGPYGGEIGLKSGLEFGQRDQ